MLTRRHMEVATGLSLAALGGLTAYGSLENGIGWTDFGPSAGYFPFRIGILIVLLGLAIAVKYALQGRRTAAAGPPLAGTQASESAAALDERFFESGALRRVGSVFLPTAVAAALIPWLGLYVSGALFLAFSMVTLGRLTVFKAALIAVATMGCFFVLFEFWFQVPLAKGLIMPLLGSIEERPMADFSNLMHGFSVALSFYHVALIIMGVLLGILVGVLPGLGAPNGVTLLLPLTFSMDPVSAIILLSSMYWGALFGGSTTSILFNIPGEPSSVATTFDGYPMAKQGRATEALATAFFSAGLGALTGVLVITLLAGWIADFALRFSSPEFFAIYLLAFCSFIGLGGNDPLKTGVSLLVGLAFATVGMDTVSGELRLTFGWTDLLRGVSFLVAVIGLFGIGELLLTVQEELNFKGVSSKIEIREIFRALARLPHYWATFLRSAAIGIWMGITPGGPTAASFMSYGIGRRFGRYGANFGKGEPEGVVAPETADHSAGTAALLPMLALGVPGSATAAVMMGGLMIWGLQPGPLLFVEQPDFVWGLIASMYLSNVIAVVLVLATVPLFASILRIPFGIIGPIIIVVCLIGAYTVASAVFDVWLAVAFGIVGYVFKRLDYPIAPLVLAMVLGDKAEDAFRQSMLYSGGSLSIFWSNWLVATLMGLAILLLVWPLLSRLLAVRRPASADAGG